MTTAPNPLSDQTAVLANMRDELNLSTKTSHEEVGAIPLYIVVRGDIPAGLQIAQAAHAVADFAQTMPDEFNTWHSLSNYIVALNGGNLDELHALKAAAHAESLQHVTFVEPDLGNEITAFAFPPSREAKQFLRRLKLAGAPQKGVKK